jgi:hypothetical protein
MTGTHSKGPAASLQLVPIKDACAQALDQGNFNDTPSIPIRRRTEGGIPITSLALVAEKKARRSRGQELLFKPFQRSKIVASADEAVVLDGCLPFKTQPHPHLLYSSVRDGKSVVKAQPH